MTMYNMEEISKERWIVGTMDGDDFYAYGGYADEDKAYKIAENINGIVIDMGA